MAAKLQDTAAKNVEGTVGKHTKLCVNLSNFLMSKSPNPSLGDSKDEKMFRSHLTPTEHQKVAKLIGEKCEINCLLDEIDTKALLDSGAQVSVLSRSFLAEQFPDIKVRNVKELLGDQNLELLAVNNLSVPYEGFVEVTLTLVGKKDNFSIRVPFLVTPAKTDQTLIGFNVICELIRANSSENIRELLLDAMLPSFNSVDDTQLKTFINFVQECGQNDLCTVKTIKKNFVIPAGKSLKIPCRVDTGPISKCLPALFEPFEVENLPYDLSVHQTLLSISPQSSRIHLQIFNSSNHDIFLPNRTELGRL